MLEDEEKPDSSENRGGGGRVGTQGGGLMADELSVKTKCQSLAAGLLSQQDSFPDLPVTLFDCLYLLVVYTCRCMSLD